MSRAAVLLITAAGLLAGCSSTEPPPASELSFVVQPSNTTVGAAIAPAIQVSLLDSDKQIVTGASATITLTISPNVAGATIGGIVSRATVDGSASFDDITVDSQGAGFTLIASAAGFPDKVSNSFNVGP